MNMAVVIAKGSGYVLVYQSVGEYSFYEVHRRESAPVHPLSEYATLVWDNEFNQVAVRDTFMGVIPNSEYEEVLSYKKELLETAKYFNLELAKPLQDRIG